VEALLTRSDTDVNKCDADGWTHLMVAARPGNGDVVRARLKASIIDVNLTNGYS
jgi:ankyrin repeat protein